MRPILCTIWYKRHVTQRDELFESHSKLANSRKQKFQTFVLAPSSSLIHAGQKKFRGGIKSAEIICSCIFGDQKDSTTEQKHLSYSLPLTRASNSTILRSTSSHNDDYSGSPLDARIMVCYLCTWSKRNHSTSLLYDDSQHGRK